MSESEANGHADVRKVWWLASYPKSGNTWVRLFMEAYITGRAEINNFYGQFVYGDLREADYQAVSGIPVGRLSAQAVNLIRPAAILHIIGCAAGADVCLKTHNARGALNFTRLIPPELTRGAVYVVRDPRDVVISWSHHNKRCANGNYDLAIDHLCDEGFNLHDDSTLFHFVGSWSRHVTSWTTEDASYPVHVVRYEDLLERPEEEFRKVLKAYRMEVDEAKLTRAIKAVSFGNLRAQEDREGFVERKGGERFFRSGRAGQWKEELSEEQVARIEKAHGATMTRFGYEPAVLSATVA